MQTEYSTLSVGRIIAAILQEDVELTESVTSIFPVLAEQEAILPYIYYRRIAIDPIPVKNSLSADTVTVEVSCCAADYEESTKLAERVRRLLDHKQAMIPGLSMRSCTLTGGEELWADDAYIQRLIFTIKA